MGNYVIQGSRFINLASSHCRAETHGILLYGVHATVTGNLIKNIKNAGTNAEGLYLKVTRGTVTGNTFEDAGNGQAYANLKGARRGGGGSGPHGMGVVFTGNSLLCTSGAHSGVYIASDEQLVSDNIFEGFGKYAIWTADVVQHNCVIANNTIKDHRGDRVINFQSRGRGNKIIDNNIDGLLASEGDFENVYGIIVFAKNGNVDDLEIRGNTINCVSTSDSVQEVRNIHVWGNGNTVTSLRILDNYVYNNNAAIRATTRGIMFSHVTITDLLMDRNDTHNTDHPIFWAATTITHMR
jgi:hypothetical protein